MGGVGVRVVVMMMMRMIGWRLRVVRGGLVVGMRSLLVAVEVCGENANRYRAANDYYLTALLLLSDASMEAWLEGPNELD